LDLFEFQGKELFADFDIPVPDGRVCSSPQEVKAAAESIGGRVVIKAQVQTGGRGKAGGIKVVEGSSEAEDTAETILGMDIRGNRVERVLVERASEIEAEYYAAVTLDRGEKKHLMMVSSKGGIDIEEVAASDPGAITRVHVDPLLGLQPHQVRSLAYGSGIAPKALEGVLDMLPKLYRLYIEADASLVEVNPLILTKSDDVIALDSKVTIDDSAMFRHPSFEELREVVATDPQERLAKEGGLNFIKLEGSVGIIGNGAGLVMSTLDVVDQAGGSAANFLDVGGGANAEMLSNALEVILTDIGVQSVLVNIFGGITRCDLVAKGIIDALERLEINVPIVVRLDGTNAEEGRKLLKEAVHPRVISAATMLEAAEKAVGVAA
jgi:succinyl-CoA synthetase beta subunit